MVIWEGLLHVTAELTEMVQEIRFSTWMRTVVVMASEEEVGQVPIVQNGEGVIVLGG